MTASVLNLANVFEICALGGTLRVPPGLAASSTQGASATWTNKLAVDGSIEVAPVTPTTPTNLNFALSGNNLTLSWPPSYLGWSLQSNIVSVVSAGSWFAVPNSSTTTQMVITVNPARSNVFYRMTLP